MDKYVALYNALSTITYDRDDEELTSDEPIYPDKPVQSIPYIFYNDIIQVITSYIPIQHQLAYSINYCVAYRKIRRFIERDFYSSFHFIMDYARVISNERVQFKEIRNLFSAFIESCYLEFNLELYKEMYEACKNFNKRDNCRLSSLLIIEFCRKSYKWDTALSAIKELQDKHNISL